MATTTYADVNPAQNKPWDDSATRFIVRQGNETKAQAAARLSADNTLTTYTLSQLRAMGVTSEPDPPTAAPLLSGAALRQAPAPFAGQLTLTVEPREIENGQFKLIRLRVVNFDSATGFYNLIDDAPPDNFGRNNYEWNYLTGTWASKDKFQARVFQRGMVYQLYKCLINPALPVLQWRDQNKMAAYDFVEFVYL